MSTQRDYWPTHQWQTAAPASVGYGSEKFAVLEQMIKSQYRNINGIVVVQRGYIVFERYDHGYGPEDPHHVASVTKSVISALVGIALDAGYIQSIDQKVLDFFPEYVPAANGSPKRAVTIRHLLTTTAPFPFSWKPGGAVQEPLDRLRRQKDWVKYTLDLLGQKGCPGAFQYCTAGTHLLSAILTRTTGQCARQFANERLFRPLGIREIPDPQMKSYRLEDVFGENVTGWVADPQGNSTGGWGLTLTPRDMARFGFLYLNRGNWDGRQIIAETWINESLTQNSNEYGYLWWLRKVQDISTFSALGAGGNMICCIPQEDLVVAIASKIVSKPYDPWLLVEKGVIPSVSD